MTPQIIPVPETGFASMDDIRTLEAGPALDLEACPSTYALLARGAALAPEAPAMSFFLRGRDYRRPFRWSQRQWLAEITRCGNLFRSLGVQRGDVVGFALPNLPETHWTIWGAEAAGIAFALNPLLEAPLLLELLRAGKVRWLVALGPTPGSDIWRKVAEVAPQLPDLRGVLAVSPLRYLRGPSGWVLRRLRRRHPRLGAVPVLDFHTELRKQPGAALSFDLPGSADVASYFCTGGTTGLPKIAMRTHRTEVANALQITAVLGREFLAPGKALFCGLPLFHVNGQIGTGLTPWSNGAHVVLGTAQGFRAPGLIPRFWAIAERYQLVSFSGVPTVYAALLQVPRGNHGLSRLRYAVCGAAPMPLELASRFQRETGITILEGYGLTEAGCVSSLNPPHGEARTGSIGLRLPWQPMRPVILDPKGSYLRDAEVDEPGTLAVTGPNLFKGYLDSGHDRGAWLEIPDGAGGTRRWLNTGDLGRVDAEGRFWLTGRSKELIIRGGHNIDPRLIEEPMHRHPAVALAAAVGRPDPVLGEVPALYVQLRPGAMATPGQLLEHACQHILERAAWPKRAVVLPALPTTPVGKIFKPALTLLEMESAFREEAEACAAEVTLCRARQDARDGYVLDWSVAGDGQALAERLGRYTFRQNRIL
jgi:acyl-CoA synthetase (AMP-forming)/AMP-acid ligase II